jgi:heptosyltransferase-2
MRILIVKLGAIGDVIRTTSLLAGLKEKFLPEGIDWLTLRAARDVLLYNPFINRIITWEEREELKAYDLVIALEDDYEVCDFAAQIKAKKQIGCFVKGAKIAYTPSAWFDMSAISKFGLEAANRLKQKNRRTFQQHMAQLLGVKFGPYVFNLTLDEIEYGRQFVRDLGIGKRERVVGINTGAGKRWQLKALSIEKTIELVKRFTKELGVVSLILGGEEEKERNELICRETGMPNGGIHSLRNFASIINQCQLVVSSDSLAMHFAIALEKKVAAFFGPTSAYEIEMYGRGARVFADMACLLCYKKACDKKPSCMDLLPLNQLFEAAKSFGS